MAALMNGNGLLACGRLWCRSRDLAALYIRSSELERIERQHHLFADEFAVYSRRRSGSSWRASRKSDFWQLNWRRIGLAWLGETSVYFLLDDNWNGCFPFLRSGFLVILCYVLLVERAGSYLDDWFRLEHFLLNCDVLR